jgi:hypothetical protein
MPRFKYVAIYFLIIFSTLSCKKTEEALPVYTVEKDFEKYIETFKIEAAKRNVKIDLSNLIIKFNANIASEKCGQCTQKPGNALSQKTIEISRETICWKDAYDQTRESLIFHELGHCILGRINHKDDLLPNKAKASIMSTNDNDQYGPCVYALDDNVDNCNKTGRREYYIDELFNPNTPIPAWAK